MEHVDTLSHQVSFAADGRQYLTFSLGQEEYGVEILKVQEIKGYSTITPIPNTPAYVKGVMNLRGTIIPVLDLRSKLGMPSAEYSPFTVIVVVNVGSKTTGLVVDGVSDVLSIPGAALQAAPDFGTRVDAGFISGVANNGEKLVVLLDLDRVLAGDAPVPAGAG